MYYNIRMNLALHYIPILIIIIYNYSVQCLIHPKYTLLGPVHRKLPPTEDVYNHLIDIMNFTFMINPPVCKNMTNLLLLIIISSKLTYQDARIKIRRTWGHVNEWNKIVFLVGEADPSEPSNVDIQKESEKYGDIIQGNFIDTYRNLTYKHVMGLKWIAHHCRIAKYVLKLDDDVILEPELFRYFLVQMLSPWGARDLIACNYMVDLLVPRSKGDVNNGKSHFVSYKEYPYKYYPTSCLGWVILYSQDAAQQLLKAAQSLPYFWVDDIHLTGICAEKAGIPRTPLGNLVMYWNRIYAKLPENKYPTYSDKLVVRFVQRE